MQLLPRRQRPTAASPASTSACRWRCSRVGHLVGLWVGVAMLRGRADRLGLGRAALRRTARPPARHAESRSAIWSHQVRFVGAGTIGVAAIWTLVKLVKPVVSGLASAMAASRVRKARPGGAAAAHRAGHSDRHRRPDHASPASRRSAGCWPTSRVEQRAWAITCVVLGRSGGLIYRRRHGLLSSRRCAATWPA